MRPRWLGYISTPRVDDTVAQARELGGKVVMPAMDIPNVGRLAHQARELGGSVLNGPMEVPGGDHIVQLADPQGAVFALHQKAERASSSA